MRRVAFALLAASLLLPAGSTVRSLRSAGETAVALRDRSEAERRRIVLGSWHTVVDEIRTRVGPGGSVDVVMLSDGAREVAVFAGAALAPRDCRFFSGWEDWRQRRRATFFHDARAANAPPGPPPGPATCVVVVDPASDPALRIVR